VDALLALALLACALLVAAQLTSLALKASALSRFKGFAALAAKSRIEFLSERFQNDPLSPEIQPGTHGPVTVEVETPDNGRIINRFQLTWEVLPLPDPRGPGFGRACEIRLRVTPVDFSDTANHQSGQNKILNLGTVVSARETR